MPFTFAHPIYVSPLKWINPRYFSLTGLVLGSMAPDFEYFLMLEPHRSIGHSLSGLLIQAIPMSLVLAVIFHVLVKEQLAIHLPAIYKLNHRAYNALGKWELKSLLNWLVFLSSIVIGFLSHIAIDACTHAHGYFVIRYSVFSQLTILQYPLYKILQYSLSVFGLLLTLGFVLRLIFRSNPKAIDIPKVTNKQRYVFWSIVVAIATLTTSLKLLLTASNNSIGILVVAPLTGTGLGLILSSFIMRKWRFE